MKLPIVLRSTHEMELGKAIDLIQDKNTVIYDKDVSIASLRLKLEKAENRIAELDIKLTVAEKKIETRNNTINELEEENNKLTNQKFKVSQRLERVMNERNELKDIKQVIEQYVKKLEFNDKMHKVNTITLGTMYNNVNRKLWCNEESKRQLRNLASHIRECDTFRKNYIATYLEEISFRLGGAEEKEFRVTTEEKAKG